MILPLILGIILGAVTVIFALQNVTVITITFFSWQLQGSLAIILLVAVLMGVIISLLIVLPETIRSYFQYRRLKKENAQLGEELRKQKELTHFARQTPATAEVIGQIERGASQDPSVL